MGKKIDLTGQRFGRLTVLEEDSQRSKQGRMKWLCRCECGNTVSVDGDKLKSGKTQSCGCLKYEIKVTLTGQRFGRLTVLNEDPQRYKNGQVKWICQCECGNTVSAIGSGLMSGSIQSCGCLNQENRAKNIIKYNIDSTRVPSLLPQKIHSNNTSGKRGVSWSKNANKWVATIGFKRKYYCLGYFNDFNEACKARDQAEEHLYGDFLNWYAEAYPDKWEQLNRNKKKLGKEI